MAAGSLSAGDPSRAQALFAERSDPKKLEAAFEAFKAAGDRIMTARCAFLRIDLFDDLKDDDDARERWIDGGLEAAAAALGTRTEEVPDRLDRFAKKDAEALFWYAALYGRKIELCSFFSQAGMAKRFRRMLERAAELDGTVYYGGPHRLLGNFCAEAPGFMGGDMDKAACEFDRAVAIAPSFFEGRVLRAEFIAVDRGDRKAFRADLDAVIETPDDVLPEVIPEQRRAKAAARALLAGEGSRF